MKQLVQFPIEGTNETILVEIDTDDEPGLKKTGPKEEIIKATQNLDHALDRVKPMAELVIKKLKGLTERPDEIQVTFGLKLTSKADAIIASASMEANYTVTLKWKHDGPADP